MMMSCEELITQLSNIAALFDDRGKGREGDGWCTEMNAGGLSMF
jgi:hypothetical protein